MKASAIDIRIAQRAVAYCVIVTTRAFDAMTNTRRHTPANLVAIEQYFAALATQRAAEARLHVLRCSQAGQRHLQTATVVT